MPKRHQAFWHRHPADRPLLGINVGFFLQRRFPRVMERMPQGRIQPGDIPVDLFLKDCDDLHVSHRDLGDYPFVSAPFVGIPWLEAIAGCPVVVSPNNIWAEACVETLERWRPPDSIAENPWARKLVELVYALANHSRGRYGIAPTLMRGPLDVLSALRGAAELPLDFVDCPDVVDRALDRCAAIWTEAARLQHAAIPNSQDGYFAGDAALRCWAPEKLLWLQEDAMSLLSPRLYRRHVLPIDRRLSDAFPCVVFHLHGSALWAIDDLIELPGIRAIELNLEAASCDVEGTWAGWRKIQQRKPVIMWRMYADDFHEWMERVRREFSSAGLSIQVSTSSLCDARKVQEGFLKYEDH